MVRCTPESGPAASGLDRRRCAESGHPTGPPWRVVDPGGWARLCVNLWHEPRRSMLSRWLDHIGVFVWLRALRPLGLDKDAGDFGERCLDLTLDTGDRRLDIGGAASVVEIEAERGQHLVRAEMHGQHLIGTDDAWCHLGDALDFGAHLRVH